MAILAVAVGLTMPACAQEYPDHTVSFVVPYPAGGTVDQVARSISEKLEGKWGSPVVVENKAGAGNIVGATAVAQSAPDGHTLLLATTSVASNDALFATLPFDTKKDFAPVVFLAASPNVILVSPKLGVKTLKELIEKAKNEELTYGSVGRGSGHHLCMEMFQTATQTKLKHIPYKGVAPAVAAVRTGEIPIYCSDTTGALGLIKDGVMIPLGITGTERATALPDVPTIAEQGVTGMETAGFIGVMTKGGTPTAIIDKLNADITEVVSDPEFVKRFAALGVDIMPGTVAEFAEFLDKSAQSYKEIVAAAGMEPAK